MLAISVLGCKDCSGVCPQGATCCALCAKLVEPKGVQRYLVMFTRNYVSANLLCRKLFGTPEEVQTFTEEVKDSAFGTFNSKCLQSLLSLNLVQLQAHAASSFQTIPEHFLTDNMKAFIGSVVTPCLRVNVTSIEPTMAPIAAQFVQALANRRLSDA